METWVRRKTLDPAEENYGNLKQTLEKTCIQGKDKKPDKQARAAVLADELEQMVETESHPSKGRRPRTGGALTFHGHSTDIYSRGSAGLRLESRQQKTAGHLSSDEGFQEHTAHSWRPRFTFRQRATAYCHHIRGQARTLSLTWQSLNKSPWHLISGLWVYLPRK